MVRRKRSASLPRYVNDASSGPSDPLQINFQWPSFRRSRVLPILAIALLYWFFFTGNKRAPSNVDSTNWKRYAYSLYATDSATLCHAVLIFEALARLGSKADRVLFYPEYWDTVVTNSRDRDSQLLVMARDKYEVKLMPGKLLSVAGKNEKTDAWTNTWDKSVTKFLAFTLEYYDRVIALDSDITLLASLDHLFLLPSTPIAMPRAYWYPTRPWPLTSLLMVIKPSLSEFERFKSSMEGGASQDIVVNHKFDMEILNERFADSALVLPHRPYALLTGEFRALNHTRYLGSSAEIWDADKVYKEAKLVHFSDWPLPKPWIMWPHEGLKEMQPDCGGSHEGTCAERRIWKGLYEDFRRRRKDICRLLSVPAPEWRDIVGGSANVNVTDGTHHEAEQVEMKTDDTKGSAKGSAKVEESVAHDI